MGRSISRCALLLTLALPSAAIADGGPSWFVTGGPGVGRTNALILPGDAGNRDEPTSAEPGIFEPDEMASDSRARLLMFGIGMVGTQGSIRGGAELLTLFGHHEAATSGYSAFVTYAGGDFGVGFMQAGFGLGSFWGGDRDGLDRVAGTVHSELGLRIAEGVVVLIRGDLLLGSEIVNPVASLGLQWIPGERVDKTTSPRRKSPLEGACCPPL